MNNTREVHYRYLISYLVSAIVLLIALRYFDVEDLVEKLSFALTISSLILAVLAIFFSVVSAQKQETQLGKLLETNAQLEAAGREVSTAATEIRSFAREAPQHFRAIDSKLESFAANFQTLKSSDVSKSELPAQARPAPLEIDESQFRRMFGQLQFAAMMVLYLFERSVAKSRSIEREAFEKLEFVSFDYAIGVFTALEAAGILAFRMHAGAVVPISCAESVRAHLPNALGKVISVVGDEQKDRIQKMRAAVDEHLAA